MNKNRIQIYFGRWNGSVSEDLEETWTKLRAAADLQAMNSLLIAMIGIKNRLVSRYETPFLKAAAVLDKVITSLAELETLVGADTHLIDLWNAKNDPSNAPSAVIQAIETFQDKRQAVQFTSTEDGTPRLTMEFTRSSLMAINPSFKIHPKQTVGWINENVRLEQKRLEFQSKDPEHKIRIETADERIQLVHNGIKYYENESIKLPTWDQITGKATDSAIQNNDGLSYRGVAYYLICEGIKINGSEAQAAELYDNLSKYSKKSTAKTRGKMIMKEYNDLKQRHQFNSRSLKNFQVLMDELKGMNILSAAGLEVLNKDKKHAEKYS